MEADLKAALLAAYGRLLTPLLRILMNEGVAYPEFADTVKRVFVELGKESAPADDPDWASRVAVATGLPRSDVVRIAAADNPAEVSTKLDQITKVLSAWHTDPSFTGPYGLPLELQLDGNEGADFSSLVDRHEIEAPPIQLLAELRRIGAVKETDTGWFKVLTRTYLPKNDVAESFERIGRAVQFLVETVAFNRRQDDPDARLFERTVTADDGIRPEDLPRFRSYVRERGQVLLEEIDNWLSQLDKPDPLNGDAVVGTGVGIYHFVEWPLLDKSAQASPAPLNKKNETGSDE
jgi:hypothetical protein